MNASAVSARQIVLAYALLISAAAAIWISILQPAWQGYRETQNIIEAEQLRLQRLEHAVANDPALDSNSSENMANELGTYIDEFSLASRTADIGGSILRQDLLLLVQEHGGKAGDTRISSGPDPSMITASMNFDIDLPGLKNLLYGLESARPYIFVDVLSIRNRKQDEARSRHHHPQLAVQINASSFWTATPTTGDDI